MCAAVNHRDRNIPLRIGETIHIQGKTEILCRPVQLKVTLFGEVALCKLMVTKETGSGALEALMSRGSGRRKTKLAREDKSSVDLCPP